MVVDDSQVREVSTPIGTVTVIGGPAGVYRVCFPAEDVPAALPSGRGRGSLDPAEVADEGAVQVAGYFAGELRDFTVPVDLGMLSGFKRRVLDAAAVIPFGETASYREMANTAGSPGAVRAAGSAMGANPVPILIPCHRVIRSDGSSGLYGGGEKAKRWLLDFEVARAWKRGQLGSFGHPATTKR